MSAATPVLSITQRLLQTHMQWEQAIKAALRKVRCAIPGVITAVDLGGDQTCTVQIALNEEIILPDGSVLPQAIKPLIHVPLVMPRGGGFSLTVPVKAGDECLVIFGDMCIDGWWQSGASGAVQAPPQLPDQIEIRRHDLSDGFAILAPWSQPRRLQNYSASSMQLRSDDGQTVIDVANGQVTITAQTVQVHATNATVAAQQVAQVTGQTVDVTGSQRVNVVGNGNTYVEGRNFLTHTHSGVASGGAVSGPVV